VNVALRAASRVRAATGEECTTGNGEESRIMSDHSMAPRCSEPVEQAVSENVRECPISAENNDVLSERQRAAIELLIAGKSLATVAEHVQIDARTLYRWRQDELFRAAVKCRRCEMWDDAAERLRALIHPALDVLAAEVHDEYDRSRMRAAGMILRFADLRKSVPPGKGEE
jgi:hypothetical protein